MPPKLSCVSGLSSHSNRSESFGGIFHLPSVLLVQCLEGKSRHVVLWRVLHVCAGVCRCAFECRDE